MCVCDHVCVGVCVCVCVCNLVCDLDTSVCVLGFSFFTM